MANWAWGPVQVSGEPEDIEAFCKLFVFADTPEEDARECFVRSYIGQKWESFKKKHLGKNRVEFDAEFAWSVSNCLINGYSQDKPGQYLTLSEACKRFKVNVVIDADEIGFGFEEHIECDKDGELIEECESLSSYKCLKCKHIQPIASFRSVNTEECWQCETIGQWEYEGEYDC